jgi:hypothetical protein
MGHTTPFFDPWDILWELGPILESINSLYPNIPTRDSKGVITYKHSPEYSGAFDWKKKIEQCSWKLPHVHKMIVKREKISQGGGCCGLKDMCELLYYIQILRPATVGKVLDAGWRETYASMVHHKLCCIINVNNKEWIKSQNTFPHITELPNFSINKLPGFKYPNYIIPPLIKLVRPVKYRKSSHKGIGSMSMGESTKSQKYVDLYMGYNVDGVSEVFGPWNKVGDRFTKSPLKTIKSVVCKESTSPGSGDSSVDFSGGVEASVKIPKKLSSSTHITINVDPCVSQYLPPMFLPKNEITVIKLGFNEEMGTYANYKLLGSSYGSAFSVGSTYISPFTLTSPFPEEPNVGEPFKTGIPKGDPYPTFNKGRGYSIY